MDSTEVIDFWFSELGPKDWFRKDAVGGNAGHGLLPSD
jgi:uncharacterized protein (DUF924 family)